MGKYSVEVRRLFWADIILEVEADSLEEAWERSIEEADSISADDSEFLNECRDDTEVIDWEEIVNG